jgi:hypothetical protein
VLAHPLLPKAFKRAGQEQGPDEQHQLLALWHNRRRSILTSRQHLVNEAEHLLCELPLELSEQLPDTKAVKPRLAALARRNRRRRYDAPTKLRLQLLEGYRAQITALDLEEKQVLAQSASTPTRARAHQEGGPADPQAPPLRRHLPAHDPRPCRHRPRLTIRPAPPRRITARDAAAVKDGPTGPSAMRAAQRHPLDGAVASATLTARRW